MSFYFALILTTIRLQAAVSEYSYVGNFFGGPAETSEDISLFDLVEDTNKYGMPGSDRNMRIFVLDPNMIEKVLRFDGLASCLVVDDDTSPEATLIFRMSDVKSFPLDIHDCKGPCDIMQGSLYLFYDSMWPQKWCPAVADNIEAKLSIPGSILPSRDCREQPIYHWEEYIYLKSSEGKAWQMCSTYWCADSQTLHVFARHGMVSNEFNHLDFNISHVEFF